VSVALILAEAFLLNYIINENEIIERKSFLPALVYIVFMSNFNVMLSLNPILFANLFIIISVNKLINTYRKDSALAEIFDASFYISIASLFYFPTIVLFPIVIVGIIIYRSLNQREILISIFGLILPYCFVITYYFWNDRLMEMYHNFGIYFKFKTLPSFDLSQPGYVLVFLESLIILFSFNKLIGNFINASQRTKKNLLIVIWLMLFAIGSFLFSPDLNMSCFSLLAVPLTVFVANYFLNMKKIWWGEIMFIVLIVSILLNDFSNYF
jgi:hypothetical protein